MIECNVCKEEKLAAGLETFQVPNDPIGVALMKQHLKSEHEIEVDF